MIGLTNVNLASCMAGGHGYMDQELVNLLTSPGSIEVHALAEYPQCMHQIWMHFGQVPLHGASRCPLMAVKSTIWLCFHAYAW